MMMMMVMVMVVVMMVMVEVEGVVVVVAAVMAARKMAVLESRTSRTKPSVKRLGTFP